MGAGESSRVAQATGSSARTICAPASTRHRHALVLDAAVQLAAVFMLEEGFDGSENRDGHGAPNSRRTSSRIVARAQVAGPPRGPTFSAAASAMLLLTVSGPWQNLALHIPIKIREIKLLPPTRDSGLNIPPRRFSVHQVPSFPSACRAAPWTACHGVRSDPVPVALVGECSMPVV